MTIDDENATKEVKKQFNDSFPTKTFIFFVVLATFLPSKQDLLLIVSASPVAKTIQESYTEGKLKKIDEVLDLALDRALIEIKKDR